MINLFSISCETAIMWMPQDLTDDKLTLVHVMVWCHGQSWQSKHNKTPLMMLYFQTSFRQLGNTLSAKFWTWIHFYPWWVFYIFMAITNGTWVHFTKSLWTHNLNLVKKIHDALAWKITMGSGHKFAHAMTAELLCHVQTCDLIGSRSNKTSSKENFHKILFISS